MSVPRPDPSSPASVADAGFSTSRRGFDQGEVREFLRMIAAELGRLQERERFLERELRNAQSNPDLESVQFDDATLTRLLGEETARVLTTARESGAEIRQKAEEAAAQLLSEASDEAARTREEAEIEASRRRTDAAADAEAELSMAKQQGREMVNEARAYRERVLSELARRRELAREQIEQLLHGRDRLMQSFERARLVAVDVVSELQPLGEPDEYVNLAPTTGPVPVMVPNAQRPDDSRRSAADVRSSGPTVDESADVADGIANDAPSSDDAVPEAPPSDPSTGDPADELTADAVAGFEAIGDTEDLEVAAAAAVSVEPTSSTSLGADALEAVDVEVIDIDEHAPDDDAPPSSADSTDLDGDDDVVVDIFSRLRADSVPAAGSPAATAESEPEANDEAAEISHDDVEVVISDGDDEATPFQRRDADLTPIIVAAAKKLKRVLADEQNQVLEALRRKEPVRDIEVLLSGADDHAATYQRAIADEVVLAANAGASMVSDGRKMRKADVAQAVAAADEVLAEWLVAPMRDRLERSVTDGDGDNAGIGQSVRSVYREWKTQHIDEQLDDVIRMAHGRGVLAAIKPGMSVVWACDDTHQACADCDDNTLAGAVVVGKEFPTGHTFAPAHMGCRCLLLPDRR